MNKKQEQWKKWYQANKQDRNKKQNEKFSCECGGKYTRAHKAYHKKSKKHQDWENSQNPPVVHITSKPIEEIVQEVVQILKDRGYT